MSLQSLCTTHRRQSPKREGQPVQGGNLLPRRLAQPGLMHAVGIDPVPKTCGQQKGQSQGEAEHLGKHQPGPLIPYSPHNSQRKPLGKHELGPLLPSELTQLYGHV